MVQFGSPVCSCFAHLEKLSPHLTLVTVSTQYATIVNFLNKYTAIQKPFVGWFSLVGGSEKSQRYISSSLVCTFHIQ